MINRMLNRLPEDPSDLLPGMNVWPDCKPGDWFYLAIQEATNSHDYSTRPATTRPGPASMRTRLEPVTKIDIL